MVYLESALFILIGLIAAAGGAVVVRIALRLPPDFQAAFVPGARIGWLVMSRTGVILRGSALVVFGIGVAAIVAEDLALAALVPMTLIGMVGLWIVLGAVMITDGVRAGRRMRSNANRQ